MNERFRSKNKSCPVHITRTHTKGKTNEEKEFTTLKCNGCLWEFWIARNRNRLLHSIVWLITNGFSMLCKWKRWQHTHTHAEELGKRKKASSTFTTDSTFGHRSRSHSAVLQMHGERKVSACNPTTDAHKLHAPLVSWGTLKFRPYSMSI